MPVDVVDVSCLREAFHAAIGMDRKDSRDVTVVRGASYTPGPSWTSS